MARLYSLIADSQPWRLAADVDPVVFAIVLPWSTTFALMVLLAWLLAIVPRLDSGFFETLRHPVSLSALAIVGVAIAGVLWGEGPWWPRLVAIGPAAKLLVLPLLLFHYQRSSRAHWVLWGFIGSCTVLLAYSFVIYVFPDWRFASAHGFDVTGVPVRNAIDQNQEFAFCGFAIAMIAVEMLRRQRTVAGTALFGLAALFFFNIFFVALARTSLAYIVALGAILAVRLLPRKAAIVALAGIVVGLAALWATSPYLRGRVMNIATEYQEFRDTNRPTSTGQRLQYWKDAIGWISEDPVIGHGTGSTRLLFNRAAEGKEGAWSDKVGNPHNQMLYVSIEWGLLGCALLLLMWYRHYDHFRGPGIVALIGTIIVAQNVFSSAFNSHIFDFTEGWMYVLGVGVAAGAIRRV